MSIVIEQDPFSNGEFFLKVKYKKFLPLWLCISVFAFKMSFNSSHQTTLSPEIIATSIKLSGNSVTEFPLQVSVLSAFSLDNLSSTVISNLSLTNTSLTVSSEGICVSGWLPTNHIMFQLANTFLFLSYLAPTGIHGLLYLRACLMLGCLFFALWGWIILCALDTLIWNAAFTVINLIHIVIILYMLRPVKFSHELEMVYRNLFKPLRVSRHQFKRAVKCMREIQTLKPRDPYCIEKVTRVDRLSLVLSGRLVVSQHGHTLHVVDSHQFLDSPEWFGVCSDDYYQVSVTALEECRLLVWHRDKLKLTISSDQFLQAIFDNILGKDVVKKLMLVTESSCNGIGLYAGDDMLAETAKLLTKSKEGRSGLDILLSRQINNRDSNVWNLAKISDGHDGETTV